MYKRKVSVMNIVKIIYIKTIIITETWAVRYLFALYSLVVSQSTDWTVSGGFWSPDKRE